MSCYLKPTKSLWSRKYKKIKVTISMYKKIEHHVLLLLFYKLQSLYKQ